MTARRARLVLVALAALVGVLVFDPVRSVPSGAGVLGWYATVGPTVAAVTGLRLAAALGCGWVLLAALLQLVATGPRPSLGWLADGVSPAVLRRLAGGALVASATVAVVGPSGAMAADPPGTASMTVIEPSSDVPVPVVPAPAAAPVLLPTPDPGPVSAETVTVEPGDSFWSLAEEVVVDAGASPSDDDVASYWRQLVAANTDRLVHPGNPDLLRPGQVLVLPPL